MSFTRINTVDGALNTAVTITPSASGHLLVICSITTDHITAMSGNSNTYVQVPSAEVFGSSFGGYSDIWYVASCNAGITAITPTVTGGGQYNLIVREYSYSGGTLAVDTATGVSSNAADALTNIALTTATASELLVSIVGSIAAISIYPSGWADTNSNTHLGTNSSSNLEDSSSTGSKPANYTFTSGSVWVESMAAFMVSSAGPTPGTTDALFPGDIPTINLRSFINLTE